MFRRRILFLLAAVCGASVVVLPAVAGSETSPTIEAENKPGAGYYKETHAWRPPQVTVSAGGVVNLSNPTEVPHGVEWVSSPEQPSCTTGVPVGMTPAASGTKWSGTCTFSKPGTYTFYCTVHHAEMTGTITVNPNGTTTTTSTTSTQPLSPGGGSTPTTSDGSPGSSGSPLAGSSTSAIRLAVSQHGKSVHGSVEVSQAGAGGRLEVELLTKRASLASAGHFADVRVGRTVHSSLPAGRVSFTVALNGKARHSLRAHRRLALTVRIALSTLRGSAVTVTRGVVAHS